MDTASAGVIPQRQGGRAAFPSSLDVRETPGLAWLLMGSRTLNKIFYHLDAKALPIAADEVAIADTEDGGRVKKVPISLLFGTAVQLTSLELKAEPTAADKLALQDAADDDAMKVATVQQVFAAEGLIAGLTAETAPATGDLVVINDISNSDAARKSTVLQLVGTAGAISGQTAKAAPLPADTLLINDSASSNAGRVSTLQQLFGAAGLVDGLTLKASPVGADTLPVNDSAASGAAKKVTIDSLPITPAQIGSILLQPAADADPVAILNTTGAIELQVTGAADVAIGTTSSVKRQEVKLIAKSVAGGGSYTLVIESGTLTLNATGEWAIVKRNEANTAWVLVAFAGATVV